MAGMLIMGHSNVPKDYWNVVAIHPPSPWDKHTQHTHIFFCLCQRGYCLSVYRPPENYWKWNGCYTKKTTEHITISCQLPSC